MATRAKPTLPGNYKPDAHADAADALARVYALILSWPAVGEARAAQAETRPADSVTEERSNGT